MKNNLTIILLLCCMVLIGFTTNELSAQNNPCYPPAAGATVVGTADATVSTTHSFTAVPVGTAIQLIANGPMDVFNISLCGTNEDGWSDGDHDSSTHILDANTDEASGANYLSNIEDGCENGAGPNFWGPDAGGWIPTAGGTFYLYITEWNAAGDANCEVSSGQTYDIEIEITVAGPCGLGTLTTPTVQSVCPAEAFEIAFDTEPVADNGFTLTWDNTNTDGTGGTATIPFSWDGFGGFPISLNSSLNGALTSPFVGTWEFTVEAYDAADEICDQSPVITITFLDAADATCSDCSVIDAGVLTSPTTQSACDAAGTFTIDLDGTQSALGGYHLAMDNSNTGGTGGTGNGIFLTVFDTNLPFTYDSDLNGILSGQATPLPPLSGTWEFTLFALNGNGERCDSTDVTTVHFVSLDVTASSSAETCQDGTGTASAAVIGGTGYTYAWSNGMTTESISDLSSGMYTVTVEDVVSGCTATGSTEVTNDIITTALTLSVSATAEDCGTSDGTATVDMVDGGSGTYTYEWSNGMTDASISGLASGVYDVTVTDMATGCSGAGTATVLQSGGATVELGTVTNVNCNGAMDGAVTITVSGGVAPYAFAWSNGETTQDISGLAGGVYTCTVTDANCPTVVTATVSEPAMALALTEDGATDISCNGASDGAIMITVSGGTTPYTFTWSNGESSEDLADLEAGDYTATVTDGNGCTAVSSMISIAEPDAIVATVDEITDATGTDDGAITITVAGGVAPYTYAWSNGEVSEDLTDLGPDDYTVTITDDTGCSIEATVAVGGFFLDVNDIDAISSFSLNPNPTTGNVKIAMSLARQNDIQLEVYDIAGKSILTDSRSNSADVVFDLDLGSFSDGVYFARFIVDGQTFTERIIKSN